MKRVLSTSLVAALAMAGSGGLAPRGSPSEYPAHSYAGQLAVAASDGQSHPVIGLWRVSLREELRHALVVEDIRKIDRWTARYPLATVEWPVDAFDPFFNANTMDDIAVAEQLAALDGG